MYDLEQYGAMIADRPRTCAYVEAILKAVKPGDVVVDIGCGPGLFTLLACRAGAKRVYAIESNESVAFARELAAANGYTSRIEILHGFSRQLSIPERANVIVSDIRGVLPLLGDAIASIEDARLRFLAPDGALIPAVDKLWAALASVPEFYEQIVSPWQDSLDGVRLSPMRERALNSTYSVNFDGGKLTSQAQEWGRFDYQSGAQGRAAAKLQFRALRKGVAHGICLWFETMLFQDIGYSSAPGQLNTVYGQLFLPWLEPVQVVAGGEILVDLHANPVGDSYIWRWDTTIPGQEGPRTFRQSMMEGARFSPEVLRRRATEFVPKVSPHGEAESWVLQSMNGATSLQEIADGAAARFPKVFRNSQEALQLVSRLSDEFAL
jgi:type I protein arginine methyltransferase